MNSANENPAEVYYTTSKLQRIAGVLAIVAALVSTAMVITWADKHDTSKNYLGGINWSKRVFNYHPVMMVIGMNLCLITSLLSYRIIELPKKITKVFHAVTHAGAIVCALVGLSAVVTSHNYKDHNGNNKYTANLYSMHSLLGISALVLYFSNYILAFFHFLMPVVSNDARASFKPNHVFLGLFTLIAATIALETGITELTTKLGCIYPVTSADWNPAENYHELSDGCKLANGLGVMILLGVFLCAYALLGPGTVALASRSDQV
uniref:Cytochrome b561 domain-containing protein n=1 Tax=Spumella elongata TaxID=89044 RepID=A0A7S3MBE7_9STRA|mmetsp:Transcript_51165/g.89285  ORF Transcript_51165/g.89285 Transcript_51165/m.89285 type:complete len:264 (+) Transcript_51165:64-855(+)|eukprot:CAMPEP_0184996202 /NCGR_PEP_ID=MMETSP1098-20130426/55569_1 /TAXON_ID=89044 /ORGANISM="Spumella elongata, Strain CCAP 955/1" /LENGTH=263 /DNA_ID=CAMNT_0027522603 /DNA_START=64 /DNA_END=855 /DNA_ORIENTATION=-